ncbi:MAG: hypothetical protein HGA67_01410 [Candidatus Yonathbacteria bacterium]|nr:hypothetical protein [Candidatus Yonathbacteria bacterium]
MAHVPKKHKAAVEAIIGGLQKAFRGADYAEQHADKKRLLSLSEQRYPRIPGFVVSWSDYRVKIFFDSGKKCLVVKYLKIGDNPVLDEHISPVMWPQNNVEAGMVPDVACICERVRKEIAADEELQKNFIEFCAEQARKNKYHSMRRRHCPCPKCNPRLKEAKTA